MPKLVEIDWHSEHDIRRDGSIRPYDQKYSTIHGWVTKLRGTLTDNESVRREGIREMRAAKAVRQWKKKHAAERRARKRGSGGSILSFLRTGSTRRSSSKATLSRDASRRSTKKGSTDVVLHFSHHSKPKPSRSSSKMSGSIRTQRTTGSRDRPTPQRRHTEMPKRQQSTRDVRPTRTNTRRSTRP